MADTARKRRILLGGKNSEGTKDSSPAWWNFIFDKYSRLGKNKRHLYLSNTVPELEDCSLYTSQHRALELEDLLSCTSYLDHPIALSRR